MPRKKPASPAPTTQDQRVQKIKNVMSVLKANGWESFSQFVTAFYTSKDGDLSTQIRSNLTYRENCAFAPAAIMDAWDEACPSGASRRQLDLAFTKKAAEVMVRETSTAAKNPELRMPSTTINVPALTTEFALKSVSEIYQKTLPCLWFLLFTVLTAENEYERKTGTSKEGKEERAMKVRHINPHHYYCC